MVWYGMVWYGMVWYGMVWYGMVWYGPGPELDKNPAPFIDNEEYMKIKIH